jgi:hypothetical protein
MQNAMLKVETTIFNVGRNANPMLDNKRNIIDD